jgi:heme oxygenase
MSDDTIYAEGLLIFYEIFRFLEEVLAKLSPRLLVFNKMDKILKGTERTKAFEDDLEFYFGKGFFRTSYSIRPAVANYLRHLKVLEEREPLRLIAYIYHLYMGLLSGGQILKKKRELKLKLTTLGGLTGTGPITRNGSENRGDAVTQFGLDGRSISEIKRDIAFTMNDIASDLSKDEKDSLISESILVFQYNNEIIRSVKNTGRAAVMAVLTSPLLILPILLVLLSLVLFWYLSIS